MCSLPQGMPSCHPAAHLDENSSLSDMGLHCPSTSSGKSLLTTDESLQVAPGKQGMKQCVLVVVAINPIIKS